MYLQAICDLKLSDSLMKIKSYSMGSKILKLCNLIYWKLRLHGIIYIHMLFSIPNQEISSYSLFFLSSLVCFESVSLFHYFWCISVWECDYVMVHNFKNMVSELVDSWWEWHFPTRWYHFIFIGLLVCFFNNWNI